MKKPQIHQNKASEQDLIPGGPELVIGYGKLRCTFQRRETGEVLLKVQGDDGLGVFAVSANTIILKNMATEVW